MEHLAAPSHTIVLPGAGRNQLFYIPYLATIEAVKRPRWRVLFKGGEVEINLAATDGVLFYGASGEVPVPFLDDAATHRVPITFHRTHKAEPLVLTPAVAAGRDDLITQQILVREDARTRLHVAKAFCVHRVSSMDWLKPVSRTTLASIRAARTLAELRSLEAEQAARYWESYCKEAGFAGTHRRDATPLSKALDAAGMLVQGVLLRWVVHHRLSPSHGFLHEPTSYTALVFDLIEPYRYLIERAVLTAASESGNSLTPERAVHYLKAELATPIYVPVTRQWVTAKHLLHGVVLALRAYLCRDMPKFTLPTAGACKPGRPYQTTYRLPGELRSPK